MDTPYGPHKVTGNRQIAIPKALADQFGIAIGQRVYFVASDDDPGTLLVVPESVLAAWTASGRVAARDTTSGDTAKDVMQ